MLAGLVSPRCMQFSAKTVIRGEGEFSASLRSLLDLFGGKDDRIFALLCRWYGFTDLLLDKYLRLYYNDKLYQNGILCL